MNLLDCVPGFTTVKGVLSFKHFSNLVKKIVPEAYPKIINFGIDTSFFKAIKKNKSKDNKLKLLSTRNHEQIYNLKTLIEASKIALSKELK